MNRNERNKLIIVGIIMFFIISTAGIVIFLTEKFKQEDQVVPLSMTLVDEYSTFFAVVNDVNQYLTFVSQKNIDAIYALLDDTFISQNKVTKDNVLSNVLTVEENTIVQANNIYYQEINGNYLYFLEGSLLKNEYEKNSIVDSNYKIFIVVDYENSSYSLIPYKEEDGNNNPLKNNSINIKRDNYNHMLTSGIITNNYICNIYYSKFLNQLFSNTGSTYDLLTKQMQQDYTKSAYVDLVEHNLQNISPTIEDCQLNEVEENRIYQITDKNNNKFEFIEESIMNYKVNFSL